MNPAELVTSHYDAVKILINNVTKSDLLVIEALNKSKWASVTDIGVKTGVSHRSLRRRLVVLVKIGIVQKKEAVISTYRLLKTSSNVVSSTLDKDTHIDRIRAIYPSRQASLQPARASQEINALFKKHGKHFADIVDKIIKYIEYQKESQDWKKHQGKFIPGLGNFLKGRSWENQVENKTLIKDTLKDIFE